MGLWVSNFPLAGSRKKNLRPDKTAKHNVSSNFFKYCGTKELFPTYGQLKIKQRRICLVAVSSESHVCKHDGVIVHEGTAPTLGVLCRKRIYTVMCWNNYCPV